VPVERSSDIAIVGGGESALSCMEFVRAVRPDAQLTIYTPGLPMSRVESFVENRIFSNPDAIDWPSLGEQTRRDFIARSDRGVFGPERIAAFAYDERCRFVPGRVVHVACARGGGGVSVEYAGELGVGCNEHDYVINGTGFDLLEQLRVLCADDARAEIERRVGPVWDRPPETELPFGRFLELEGLESVAKGCLGIDHNAAAAREPDHHVRAQSSLFRLETRLLGEVAVRGHAGQLRHTSQGELAPAAPSMGRSERAHEARGLGRKARERVPRARSLDEPTFLEGTELALVILQGGGEG